MFETNDLIQQQEILAHKILDRMYPNQTFDDYVRKKSIEDIKWLLLYIKEGFTLDNPKLVSNLIAWLKDVFKGVSIDPNEAENLFHSTVIVLKQTFSDEIFHNFLNKIDLNKKEEFYHTSLIHLKEEQKLYLELLLKSKRFEAMKLIQDLIADSIKIEDIYLSIFQETMRQVGELWQQNKISVAVEHYCTVVTQYIMSNLYEHVIDHQKSGKRVLTCSVGSELHELGSRMVSDFFEMDGWEVRYLGPNLPERELATYAKDFRPDVIAISVTMPHHVSILKDTIAKLRTHDFLNHTKIIVGGLPFIDQPELVHKVGADALGIDALDGVKVANEITG